MVLYNHLRDKKDSGMFHRLSSTVPTNCFCGRSAVVAQLVERRPSKSEVAGSCPVYRSNHASLAQMEEQCPSKARVGSSSLSRGASGNLISWLLMQVNWIVTLLKLKKCEDG